MSPGDQHLPGDEAEEGVGCDGSFRALTQLTARLPVWCGSGFELSPHHAAQSTRLSVPPAGTGRRETRWL